MKKHIIIIFAALIACSCSEWLERTPANKFAAETFFASESDLELYANGLINSALPGASDMALGSDRYTDFCGTRQSYDFFWGTFTAAQATNWNSSTWSFNRRVAYMIENMPRCKNNVSSEIYNHYEGVARFWRTWITLKRMKVFGDIYFIDKVIQPSDSLILYGTRQDREYIWHRMKEDLEFACENCLTSGQGINSAGRVYVNKYVALAFASHAFLFEGTYRKYHSVNPSTGKPWNGEYESANELLSLAEKYAKELIDTKAFSLNSDYRSLFVSATLPTDEVIWGCTYSSELSTNHGVTYKYCSTTSSLSYSPTKEYVRMFLKTDGTAITDDEAKQSITKEFEGRDSRLAATVLGPGRDIVDMSGNPTHETIDFTFCKTGYQIVKWSIPDASHFQNSIDENSIPIIRYPEVLLNYAEACEELGEMTEEIWNQTVGALRNRAGVANVYPTARDPWLYEYYTKDLVHPATDISPVGLEIRRERVTELTFESELRQNDLYRYGQADLVVRRYNGVGWAGIWVTAGEAANGLVFEKETYTFESASGGAVNSTTCYPIKDEADAVNTDWFFSEGDHGYLVYKYALKWEPRKYCRPIPLSAYNVNPKLGQNKDWE